MKFHRDRTVRRSDLNDVASYRRAARDGELTIAWVRPTNVRSCLPHWAVRNVSEIAFPDPAAEKQLEVAGFAILVRAPVVDELTRHRDTHQVFVPLTGPILAVVALGGAPDADTPDSATIVAVPVLPGEGLVIGRGTWHTLPFVFVREVLCLSVMHREDLDSYHDVRDLAALGWVGFLDWKDDPSS